MLQAIRDPERGCEKRYKPARIPTSDKRIIGTFRTQKQIWNPGQELDGGGVGNCPGQHFGKQCSPCSVNASPEKAWQACSHSWGFPYPLPSAGFKFSKCMLSQEIKENFCSIDGKHLILFSWHCHKNEQMPDSQIFINERFQKSKKLFQRIKGMKKEVEETLSFVLTQLSMYFKVTFIFYVMSFQF